MFFKKYKVKLKGRSKVVYIEGDKQLTIDSEMLSTPADLVIYINNKTTWDDPFACVSLSEQDRCRIVKNIRSELEKDGLIISFE
jgi:hypothetical protein